jgi:putative two-component system response regulator
MTLEKPNILLVDDDRTTIELMGAVLETQGLHIDRCCDAESAIKLLESITFDAVVTDVIFDGRPEGDQILAACRKLQPKAVVILMTGYPAIDNAVSAIKSGATDYLQKPVDPIVLGAMVHKALKERQLDENPDALQFNDMVDILSDMVAQTIERVDPYTAGHAERTRKYSRIMGENFGLDSYTLERLELGAIAHDYGKIYLDDQGFLTKKGKLTEAEYTEVKRHPELGARKLGAHPQLRDVCRYVVEHHERWDGKGYPYGISEEKISLPGRILGVVEVFDSLSTRRSYKPAWSLERMQDFFDEYRGTAFDPQVIDEFQRLLGLHGKEWVAQPQKDLESVGLTLEE